MTECNIYSLVPAIQATSLTIKIKTDKNVFIVVQRGHYVPFKSYIFGFDDFFKVILGVIRGYIRGYKRFYLFQQWQRQLKGSKWERELATLVEWRGKKSQTHSCIA